MKYFINGNEVSHTQFFREAKVTTQVQRKVTYDLLRGKEVEISGKRFKVEK